MRTVIPDHIVGWFEKLKNNIIDFKSRRHIMSKDEQIDFIRQQFILLQIITSVLDGEMYFTGVRHDNIDKRKE